MEWERKNEKEQGKLEQPQNGGVQTLSSQLLISIFGCDVYNKKKQRVCAQGYSKLKS